MWKYTDTTNTVVFRTHADGTRESMLASALSPEIDIEPADPPPLPDMIAFRKAAYIAESDPLFFKWQRGEATREEWLAKIAEIQARYPISAVAE